MNWEFDEMRWFRVDIASIGSFRVRVNARAATHSELEFMVICSGGILSLVITHDRCIDTAALDRPSYQSDTARTCANAVGTSDLFAQSALTLPSIAHFAVCRSSQRTTQSICSSRSIIKKIIPNTSPATAASQRLRVSSLHPL